MKRLHKIPELPYFYVRWNTHRLSLFLVNGWTYKSLPSYDRLMRVSLEIDKMGIGYDAV
jgi:hypothetical protein